MARAPARDTAPATASRRRTCAGWPRSRVNNTRSQARVVSDGAWTPAGTALRGDRDESTEVVTP